VILWLHMPKNAEKGRKIQVSWGEKKTENGVIWNKYRFLDVQISPQCNINEYGKITTLFSPLSRGFVTPDAKKCWKWGENSSLMGWKTENRVIWNKYRFLEVQISPQCNINGYGNITTLFSPLSRGFVTPDAKKFRKWEKISSLMGWKTENWVIWNKYHFLDVQISSQCNINEYGKITTLFSPLSKGFVTPDAKKCRKWGQNSSFMGVKNKISDDME